MATRRFGPTLGAGVVVREEDGDKPIQPAQLGVTGMTGILERGPVGRIFAAPKRRDFLARAGSYIPESQVPDAAFDFYNLSNGAGEIWLDRITDGTELSAEIILKNRATPVRKEVLKILAGYQGEANPGRWAGRKRCIVADYSSVGTNTLDTGKTMLANEYEGALLTLSAVSGKSFKVISNDVAGVLTFAADVDLTAELAGSPNQLYILELSNEGRELTVDVLDGIDDPENNFGLVFRVNGDEVKRYDDVSMDPASAVYVLKVVNEDDGNFWARAENLVPGDTPSPALRPANFYGLIKTVTALTLTKELYELQPALQDAAVVAALSAFTPGGSVKKDVITLTCNTAAAGAAVFDVESDVQGTLPDLTEDVAYVSNEFLADFTLTNSGANEYTVGDVIVIAIDPFPANNGLEGAILTPDQINNRRTKFIIDSNTVDSVTVRVGSDLTSVGDINDEWRIEVPQGLGGGYDGIEEVDDGEYIQAYDTASGNFNSLFGKNKGFVKLACPGVSSVAVQKQGLAYAESRNYGFRVEIPSNITTDEGAEAFINESLGRNDFGKVHFPSYAYVTNPEGAGLKLTTMSGAILGREALVAKNFDGYHKIAGGIDVVLSNIVKLPTGERSLDEEVLNPAGINVLKQAQGNFIMWGARTISIDPAFRFAQKREQLSHYENIFRESFDFIIFAINNATARQRLLTSFTTFFLPEFAKSAIVGNTFDEAVRIKIDDENNPLSEAAAGRLNAEIRLRIADTVEQFVITIGQAGIFEDLTA